MIGRGAANGRMKFDRIPLRSVGLKKFQIDLNSVIKACRFHSVYDRVVLAINFAFLRLRSDLE